MLGNANRTPVSTTMSTRALSQVGYLFITGRCAVSGVVERIFWYDLRDAGFLHLDLGVLRDLHDDVVLADTRDLAEDTACRCARTPPVEELMRSVCSLLVPWRAVACKFGRPLLMPWAQCGSAPAAGVAPPKGGYGLLMLAAVDSSLDKRSAWRRARAHSLFLHRRGCGDGILKCAPPEGEYGVLEFAKTA